MLWFLNCLFHVFVDLTVALLKGMDICMEFVMDDRQVFHYVLCGAFLRSKYCDTDEYYRLQMKPSVYNKVEQIQNGTSG